MGEYTLNRPDFLVISPSKCGTNTLFHLLKSHPDICMAKHVKGTRFFNRFYNRGIEWYRRLFDHCPGNAVAGEVDETYFVYEPCIAERIHRHLPDVKLILCLRNPVDRAYSLYMQFARFGLIKEKSLKEALKTDFSYQHLVTDNFYEIYLNRFLAVFPKEQIQVILFEDLTNQMEATVKNLYRFLGVDPHFFPTDENLKRNAARDARFSHLNKLFYFVLIACRHLGFQAAIARAKQSKAVQALLFKKPEETVYPSLDPDLKQELQSLFKTPNQALAELIGRDLDHWQED